MDIERRNNIIGATAIVTLALGLRLPYAGYSFILTDETIYATIAREILHGAIPFRDVWELKPPLIYYLYALLFLIFGDSSLTPVHVSVAVSVALTSLVVADIARREWGRGAGLMAGLGLAAYSTFCNLDGVLAADTEIFLILPQCIAVRYFLMDRPDKARRDLYLAGLFSGMAVMFKQPAATTVLLMAAWTAVSPTKGITRKSALVTYLTGAGTVAILFLAYFYHKGALWDSIILMTVKNFQYIANDRNDSSVFIVMILSIYFISRVNGILWLVAFGATSAALYSSIAHRIDDRGRHNLFLALYLLASTLATCCRGYVSVHYYIMMIPSLALLWTCGSFAVWQALSSRKMKILFAVLLCIGVIVPFVFFHLVQGREIVKSQFVPLSAYFKHMGKLIQARTRPDDRIFVWGLRPQLFYYSDRRPAGRFLYLDFQSWDTEVAGTSEQIRTDTQHAIKESWKLLLQDLETYKPALILDASYPQGLPKLKRIGQNPIVQPWLDAHYMIEGIYGGIGFYVRKN